MKKVVFISGSVTYALKIKKMLLRAGVNAKIIKVSDDKEYNGCTHGIEISEDDYLLAVQILRSNNMDYRIYNK